MPNKPGYQQTIKYKEYRRRYRQRPEVKARKREYAQSYEGKLRIRNYGRVYRSNHRFYLNEKSKEQYKKRKTLTIHIIQEIYEENIKQYGTLTCYLCLKPICFGDDHLDHKIPLSRGGNNEKYNLGVTHKHCNLCKRTRTPDEYWLSAPILKQSERASAP